MSISLVLGWCYVGSFVFGVGDTSNYHNGFLASKYVGAGWYAQWGQFDDCWA